MRGGCSTIKFGFQLGVPLSFGFLKDGSTLKMRYFTLFFFPNERDPPMVSGMI
jgi:hypothetical protein